eukprot:TRINITY_DN3394_c0_g1_i1.p1 TRINITY_DN3394_c0_g1~~TRINITY_DN3394_c0_g1_i1.p1  ORF type:complete len:167 (+),score=28.75 TRINITY_DN3394_c0_g1_i1:1-501(+)
MKVNFQVYGEPGTTVFRSGWRVPTLPEALNGKLSKSEFDAITHDIRKLFEKYPGNLRLFLLFIGIFLNYVLVGPICHTLLNTTLSGDILWKVLLLIQLAAGVSMLAYFIRAERADLEATQLDIAIYERRLNQKYGHRGLSWSITLSHSRFRYDIATFEVEVNDPVV